MRNHALWVVVLGLLLTTLAQAESNNLNRAKNTVNNIRQADPPTVSTGTVVTPQRPVQQMPRGGSDVHRMKTNPPPSPGR